MTYGIIFIILLVALIIGIMVWFGTSIHIRRLENFVWGMTIPTLILSVVFFLILPIVSYISYVGLKEYESGKYIQYITAVEEYNRIISQHRGKQNEITDLKFQGFQEPMVRLIREHRYELTIYNTSLISKRVLEKNCLIGFLIFGPDSDMEILPFVPITQ